MISAHGVTSEPVVIPIEAEVDAESLSQNSRATESDNSEASDGTTESGIAAAPKAETNNGNPTTNVESGEDAADVPVEDTSVAKTDASGRPIPDMWKKRCAETQNFDLSPPLILYIEHSWSCTKCTHFTTTTTIDRAAQLHLNCVRVQVTVICP